MGRAELLVGVGQEEMGFELISAAVVLGPWAGASLLCTFISSCVKQI